MEGVEVAPELGVGVVKELELVEVYNKGKPPSEGAPAG